MTTKKPPELRLGSESNIPLNGGLSLKYEESALAYGQSPKMQNMNADDRGSLIKRWGQSYVYPTTLGTGGINGVYSNYKGNKIIAWGGNLYTQSGGDQPAQIYSGLANAQTTFFTYNGVLYIMDGTHYMQYDGTTVKAVVPYKPIIRTLCSPDYSESTKNEDWNLIGTGFRVQYSGDGTTKVYKLPFKNLDADALTATVDGTDMTENNQFTVDRANGNVIFTNAPSVAGNLNKNNVMITAYKTQAGLPQQILNCTFAIEAFSVIWLCKNPNLPNYYWCGGATDAIDASYFPQNRFYVVGGADKMTTGFALHYGELILFKEDRIERIYQATDPNNNISYPRTTINAKIGCDMSGTIQTANNDIIFSNTYGGVYILQRQAGSYADDRIVQPISGNINGIPERPGLLQKPVLDLKAATSYVHNNKYYLCVLDICYVWDFDIMYYVQGSTSQYNLTWWYYTNINAGCWYNDGSTLCYGDRNNGLLCQFINVCNDFGQPINAIWRSKLMDFNYPDWEKTVLYIWLTTRANANSAITINYYDDNETLVTSTAVPATSTKSFSWADFSWDSFTWEVQRFAPTIKDMPKLKKIVYFQVEFSNNNFNENLSIINLIIRYNLNKKVR